MLFLGRTRGFRPLSSNLTWVLALLCVLLFSRCSICTESALICQLSFLQNAVQQSESAHEVLALGWFCAFFFFFFSCIFNDQLWNSPSKGEVCKYWFGISKNVRIVAMAWAKRAATRRSCCRAAVQAALPWPALGAQQSPGCCSSISPRATGQLWKATVLAGWERNSGGAAVLQALWDGTQRMGVCNLQIDMV